MKFPFQLLLLELTDLRTGLVYENSRQQEVYCRGLIGGYGIGAGIAYYEQKRLLELLENCYKNRGKPFPCPENLGPQVPRWMISK